MGQYPYLTLNQYYRHLFGKKTAKISLDGGFTCPNRDGKIATGGCLFCSVGGSGDFAEDARLSIEEQVARGKQQTKGKWPDAVYIAYFQAFTNTYASPQTLTALYDEALSHEAVVGLSIATRPDCLEKEVLDVLERFAQKTHLWVELGLQTAKEETAISIRRGYANDVFVQAVNNLHARNVPVVVHLIIGLPHETEEDVLATIDFINDLPVHGVKLQLLHVLKDTDLATLYNEGSYVPLEKEAYIRNLGRAISRLRPDIVIHRLTGDGDRQTLLAPLWSLHKTDVRNSLHRFLRENHIHQGNTYKK